MKKQTGKSILRAQKTAQQNKLFNLNSWYRKEDVAYVLYDLNPLYLVSDQTFSYWIRKLYKGTFKKRGLITFYQGKYLNPVIDTLISYKKGIIKCQNLYQH